LNGCPGLSSRIKARLRACQCVFRCVCYSGCNIWGRTAAIAATCEVVNQICDMLTAIITTGFFEQGSDACDQCADRSAKQHAAGHP
jgi:hypothetical protein